MTVWYAGAAVGAAAVQNVGATFDGEVGVRVWRNLDVSLEGGWIQDASTRRRQGLATPLIAFLQQTQGQTATAKVVAPALYTLANFRWVFESHRRYRPYIVFGVGGGRLNVKSTFTLGTTDITNSLGQYGVTVGGDLTGHSSAVAVNGGLGVLIPLNGWFMDAGYRLTSIMTSGQTTNVNRLDVGVFARF